jgi:hypothetical protein
MGCNFKKYTAQNDAKQMEILHTTSYVSVPKLAPFISKRAAEAIRPTTTGRRPAKMPFITGLSRCLVMKWLEYITKKNDGNTTVRVHRTDPSIPHSGDDNSREECIGATYPIYVAELIPIGPGVI